MPVAARALEAEVRTYRAHRAELLKEARGKWALVHDAQILGTYDTQMDAINAGYAKLGNVPFLVKQICRAQSVYELVSFSVGE